MTKSGRIMGYFFNFDIVLPDKKRMKFVFSCHIQ